jgi:hypothetical protein
MRLCVGVGGERGVSENAFSKSKLSCVINVSIEKLFQNLSVITTKSQCDNNRMPRLKTSYTHTRAQDFIYFKT